MPPSDPEDLLAIAREAWRSFVLCDSNIQRLSGYRSLNSAMRGDLSRSIAGKDKATNTLNEVLGFGAEDRLRQSKNLTEG